MHQPHPNGILERNTAGLTVEIAHLPIMEMTVLVCSVEDRQFATTVPNDKALDAFHHPMLYLAPAHIEALGIK